MIHITHAIGRRMISRRIPCAPRGLRLTASVTSAAGIPFPDYVKQFDNLVEMQQVSCRTHHDKKFIGVMGKDKFKYITYAEFGGQVDRFRTALSRAGLAHGDKIAIISNNRPEWAVTFYAANGLGAVIVPLYEAQTEKDWKFIIQNSDAKLLIVATQAIYAKTLSYVGPDFPRLESIICLEDDVSGAFSYNSIIASVDSCDIILPIKISREDLSAIMYTSGSTGIPKGVCLTHCNISSNVKGVLTAWGAEEVAECPKLSKICYLPWSHAFGLILLHTVVAVGTSIALTPKREAILQTIDTIKPPDLSSVPILLNKVYAGVSANIGAMSPIQRALVMTAFSIARKRNALLESAKPVNYLVNLQFKIADKIVLSKIRRKILGGHLRYISAGGGKTSVQVLQFFEDIGIPVLEGYGMTEAGPVVSMSLRGFHTRRLGAVGKPIMGTGVHIRNADLQVLGPDAEGEICVTGPSIANGYYKNEFETSECFVIDPSTQIKYLRTGDLGIINSEGFLSISGRIKEQYKLQNGRFVSPSPIEDYMCRSIFISQCVVYGTDREYNIALIVPDLIELKQWARGQHINEALGDISPDGVRAFLDSPAVVALINNELKLYATDLKNYEIIHKWTFLDEPFSHDNDMLTQKMSMKRQNVIRAYQGLIDHVYSGNAGNIVT